MILPSLGARPWTTGGIISELKPKSGQGPKLASCMCVGSSFWDTDTDKPSHAFGESLEQAAPGLLSPLGAVGLQG